jgi:hypothetical protein
MLFEHAKLYQYCSICKDVTEIAKKCPPFICYKLHKEETMTPIPEKIKPSNGKLWVLKRGPNHWLGKGRDGKIHWVESLDAAETFPTVGEALVALHEHGYKNGQKYSNEPYTPYPITLARVHEGRHVTSVIR